MKLESVPVTVGGQRFEFELCSRLLDFSDEDGPDVEFFWMDVSQLRTGGGANCRACLDSWWACMATESLAAERADHSDEEREQVRCNEVNLVLSTLFPMVARDKGTQKVVRDASPRRHFWESAADRYSLESAEAQRLRAVARTRDVSVIGQEIRQALVGDLPPAHEKQKFNEAYRQWMDNAADVLRRDGRERMEAFLKTELMPWLRKYRRRSDQKAGSGRARQFINMVAYEARAAFNTCFANAWVSLVPWLRKHRNLQPASERLLELMHNQNPRDNERDVFFGQILSLHPSSIWLFETPDHRAVLGRYLASVANYEAGIAIDNVRNPAYWEFVGSTLIAFNEYRRQLEIDEAARPGVVRRRAQTTGNASRRKNEVDTEARLFEDFAVTSGLPCGTCGSLDLLFRRQEVSDVHDEELRVTYACAACGKTHVEIVDADALLAAADAKEQQP